MRELAGPPDAVPLVLLHGLTASSDLSWFAAMEALGREFRVLALPHRGYGGGFPAAGPVDLDQLADDAVAVAEALGLLRFVAVGYSLGGAVAQLVWQRHRERVRGLVLCSTATSFVETTRERILWRALPAWTSVVRQWPALGRRFVGATLADRLAGSPWQEWAVAELARASPHHMLSGAHALGRFSSEGWIGAMDVPCAVVATTADVLVPIERQRALAAAIPGATLHEVEADHGAPVARPDLFVPALLEACRQAARGRRR